MLTRVNGFAGNGKSRRPARTPESSQRRSMKSLRRDRAEATGKFIPDAVVETMRKTFEYPEMSEGFDKIIGSPYEIFKEKKD